MVTPMLLPRRTILTGIASLICAPAIIKVAGIMPIKPSLMPPIGDGVSLTTIEHPPFLDELPHFMLNEGGTVVKLDGWLAYLANYEKTHVGVGNTMIDDARVSTVFMGVDLCPWHSIFKNEEPPLTFETMVLSGPLAGTRRRYVTLEQAIHGHRRMVALVKRYGKLDGGAS